MNEVPKCVAGDATQQKPYQEALQGRLADALISDPPYCLLTRRRKGGDLRDPKHRKIDRDPVLRFESVRDYRIFTEKWLTHAVAHLKPEAPLVLWTNFLGKEPLISAAQKLGYAHLAGEFIWAKRTKESNASEYILRVYETALVLLRTASSDTAQIDQRPISWAYVSGYDDEKEGEVWGNHPHHKPFGLLDVIIRTWSNPGDLILEPFAGSGSIPAAALQLKRDVACIELKEEWAQRVTERMNGLIKMSDYQLRSLK